jgi:ribulose-5-phosphate 4-epimerase/fuculose-1-phosphate aldolase
MANQITPHLDRQGRPASHRRIECSAPEWEARLQLAACYRIFAELGWAESIYNHISLRVPGEDGAFLINPFGLLYDEVTASNLVKIDIAGNTLDGSPYPVNKAGFTQHGYFHSHLGWAHAICHVHTTATMAVCSHPDGLLPHSLYAANFDGRLAWHDFEGVTVRPEEGARLLANLGDKRVLMLRNHGPVVLAPTIPAMFVTMWTLQRACEVQVATLAMGPAHPVTPEAIAQNHRDMAEIQHPDRLGEFDFAAWVRRIDRIDRSWRD